MPFRMRHYPALPVKVTAFLVTVFVATGLTAFNGSESYYIVGNRETASELEKLFDVLNNTEELSARDRSVVIEQIAANLHRAGHPERMKVFLTEYVEEHRDDPYNGYYLLLVAQYYDSNGGKPVAQHYYERLLTNYPNLEVRGESIHFQALQRLVELTDNDQDRLEYYRRITEDYHNKVDIGQKYFYLARSYENLGLWDNAYEAYREFLKHPDSTVPGYPDAHREIEAKVSFYDSPRDWTRESLDDLVRDIKVALSRQSPNQLLRHRAKENFFAMSWEQQESDFNSRIEFDIGTFMQRRPVRYSRDLEISSNAREAYLRTWNWSYRINTWYLYFRRVDFPADPEIHNNWEWAGVYFGEQL